MAVAYRACNVEGDRFVAEDRFVRFDNERPYEIPTSPRSPDMQDDLVAFASGDDPGQPGFGTWMIRDGEQPWRPAGITWRSWYPGRFDPSGTYWLSGKTGDLGHDSGRATYWLWTDGVALGPFLSGTTNIEGIADFRPDPMSPSGWFPIWQNRGQPLVVDGYRLPQWFQTAHWLCGVNAPTDRFIAKDLRSGVWYLVTNETSPVIPNAVKEQTDGTLLIAWNGNQESFLWSGDDWPILTEPPVIIPAFQKTTQKIGIGLFDDLVGPRIQDFSEVVSPNTRAIFWQVGTEGQSKSKALAKSLNVGAEAYKDGYGLPSIPDGFRALVFAYPTETLDVATSLGRVETTLKALKAQQVPCDLAVAMYCQYRAPGDYALPLQKVLDMLAGAWRLGLAYKVGALWGFTKRRLRNGTVVDGVDYWPELRECYERMKAASDDWEHFPPFSTVPPETFWAPLGDL